jgi:hypothetical protein
MTPFGLDPSMAPHLEPVEQAHGPSPKMAGSATDRRGVVRSPTRWLARWIGYTYAVVLRRLTCSASAFWVDVRLREINRRWIASADTPDGPSLGLGQRAVDAIEGALEPFEGIVDELLASLPQGGLGLPGLGPCPRHIERRLPGTGPSS